MAAAVYSDKIGERKTRWKRFYEGDPEVPILFIIRPPPASDKPMLWPDKKDERIRWVTDDYRNQLESLEWLESDLVPFADLITGTEIFAEAFGCRVHRPDAGMPFALPYVKTADEAAGVRAPDLYDSTLNIQFEIADAVLHQIGDDAVLKMVDIQTPIDIAALIWDKEYFFPALVLEPGAVRELMDTVKNLQTAFFDEWKRRYGREFIAHYPSYYMPDGITVSEDEAGAISPEMFDAFCLGDLNYFGERYGGLGIHCCADAQHQWTGFRKIPSLKLLNLNQPGDVLDEAFEFFKGHVPLLPIPVQFDKSEPVSPRPDRPNTVYMFNPGTREEAAALSEELSALRRSMIDRAG